MDDIKDYLSEKLGIDYGQTTADNEFTLIPVPCLGDCNNAPVMMVGQDLHRNLTKDGIDEIIDQYRNKVRNTLESKQSNWAVNWFLIR